MENFDREIQNASDLIDRNLGSMKEDTRVTAYQNILNVVRNLNDNIAGKIWSEIEPNQPMSINKVASKFGSKREFIFIYQFDKCLRKSVSHFTPSEDGAERLIYKYYDYLLKLKLCVKNRYGLDILKNIDRFVFEKDKNNDYYAKVAEQIKKTVSGDSAFDNYYISYKKPFLVDGEIFYELSFEPADDKDNKFNRLTAFTKFDILTNYCVSLRFEKRTVELFNVQFPILIIVGWQASIRPCEFDKLGRIFRTDLTTSRNTNEYRFLMEYITQTSDTLVDIIDYEETKFKRFLATANERINGGSKRLIDLIVSSRKLVMSNNTWTNLIRYLLNTMKNSFIKDQIPKGEEAFLYPSERPLFVTKLSYGFDKMPFYLFPCEHKTNLFDLIDCIDPSGREDELLARALRNNTEQLEIIYTDKHELEQRFGDQDKIYELVNTFNGKLITKHQTEKIAELFGKYLYITGYENGLREIVTALTNYSSMTCPFEERFSDGSVENLKTIGEEINRLDDLEKENALKGMFKGSNIHLIYGAAGTGKSTLINHIAFLMTGMKKLYLAKTNPAVENLKRKVRIKEENDEFITLDSFIKRKRYEHVAFDLIVIDECSTLKNDELLKILKKAQNACLVLTGDPYQIEAIGFGNWFRFAKYYVPGACVTELTKPYRSANKNLTELWNEVRSLKNDNIIEEILVKENYTYPISDKIFERKAPDEIILCLNYNGLYGLNNINKLLQLANKNRPVFIGVWQFKKDDPILFNDSKRFDALYNNLKGVIRDIIDQNTSVYFKVILEACIPEENVKACPGLDYFGEESGKTMVGFGVVRRNQYASDSDSVSNAHVLPFQLAYAVSIHKSQGLEYDSVKIVISDDVENAITHNIFYTAITRAKQHLSIYWSPEVCRNVIGNLKLHDEKDFNLFKANNADLFV